MVDAARVRELLGRSSSQEIPPKLVPQGNAGRLGGCGFLGAISFQSHVIHGSGRLVAKLFE